jgi:hypothetical protein
VDPVKHLIAIAERERHKRRYPAPVRSTPLPDAAQAVPGQDPPRGQEQPADKGWKPRQP